MRSFRECSFNPFPTILYYNTHIYKFRNNKSEPVPVKLQVLIHFLVYFLISMLIYLRIFHIDLYEDSDEIISREIDFPNLIDPGIIMKSVLTISDSLFFLKGAKKYAE